jgi:hypothetical protein
MPTNDKPPTAYPTGQQVAQLSCYCFALASVFCLAVYDIHKIGLPEYDSVKNFLICREIASGNFSAMFHHASPSFFLFFALCYAVYPSHLFLLYLNTALSVVAISLIVNNLSNLFKLKPYTQSLLLLFVGSSTYLVYGTRSLSIESMTLLGFALFLQVYSQTQAVLLPQKMNTNTVLLWLCLGFLLTINYKILLFLVVLFCIEFTLFYTKIPKQSPFLLHFVRSTAFFCHYLLTIKATLVKIIGVLLLPFLGFFLLGLLLGVAAKSYPLVWYALLFAKTNSNPWRAFSTFSFDIAFYFQYLLRIENPVLLLGLLLFVWQNFQIILKIKWFYKENYLLGGLKPHNRLKPISSEHNPLTTKLLLIMLFTFLQMTILPKAPRGILLLFPLLYGFAFAGWYGSYKKIKSQIEANYPKKLLNGCLAVAIVLSLGYQFDKLNKNIYTYQQSNYAPIVQVLQAQKATKVMATAGINLQFFLPQTIDFQVILFPKDIATYKAQGFEYLLIDQYYQVIGATVFDTLTLPQTAKTLFRGTEKTLLPPLLHLEHCEFTGYTFEQALANQKTMAAHAQHLHLIKL